jgi:hypothetical protein
MNIYKHQCIDITTNILSFSLILDEWLFMKGAQREKKIKHKKKNKKKENQRENLERKRGKIK